MHNRAGLFSVLALLAMGAFLALSGAQAAPEKPARRPNLLFILSDDQRYDTMGCAGNRIIRTPNMDALARGGVRFKNAFVTTPICAASRATLLTGLYERTHRYTFNTPPIADPHVDDSYPARLREAGYRTGFIGKFGVDVEKGRESRMFDYFRPLNRTPYFKKQPDGTERFLEDIVGDRALEFLDGCKPDQPFNLSISFNAPHAEDNDPKQYFWPTRFDALYRDVTFPIPKTMSDEFWAKQPEFLKNTESRVRFHWRFDEPQKYQEMVRGYYRMITAIDDVIGRVREGLEKRGLADNTVIVFAADNGYFLGERGFADKWYGYEYSLRVPMIVYDPRLPGARRGKVAEAVALNVDVAPTLLDLAGIPAPTRYQGRSLMPLVQGKVPSDWRKEFFFEHLFERDNIPKSEGIRTPRWTYIRWFQQQPLVEELYDHEADFEETHNLIASPEHQDLLRTLRARTDALRDSYGGPFRPNPKPKKAAAAGQ
jgi:arylsulfatase A-like enzyme